MEGTFLSHSWKISGNSVYNALTVLILLAVLAAIWVPLRPSFPSGTQLPDDSWPVALNEAVRLGLPFGDGFLFTFGPYASVYSGQFHEATDALMLLGSGIIAVCSAALMLSIAAIRGRLIVLIVALVILAMPRQKEALLFQKDALLFGYPLLFILFIYFRYATTPSDPATFRGVRRILLGIFLVPFGLLPLVKASAFAVAAPLLLLTIVLLCHSRYWLEAAIVAVVPIASSIALWAIAGQPPQAFVSYFVDLVPIVSGYTDAMSVWSSKTEYRLYVLASATVLLGILRKRDETWRNRTFLVIGFGICLFLAFKAGFVRHDYHALVAGTVCLIAAMFASFIRPPAMPLILLTALACWTVIDAHYMKTSTHQVVRNLIDPFVALQEGWRLRAKGDNQLAAMAQEQRNRLMAQCPIEKLDGTADIYSFRQACLIYAGNTWSPRPVFQSYAAYTPRLAAMNAGHLLGERAPKHVLFRVEPIDGRLPALEDGPSWPLLMHLYAPRRIDGDLAYLERRKSVPAPLKVVYGESIKARMGETTAVPLHDMPVMAEISLKPSILGRISSFLFKSPAPSIRVDTPAGSSEFRFVPGMGDAGFVLSPHITAARDLVLVQEGSASFMRSNRVTHFALVAPKRSGMFWSDTYTVRFAAIPFEPSTTTMANGISRHAGPTADALGAQDELREKH